MYQLAVMSLDDAQHSFDAALADKKMDDVALVRKVRHNGYLGE
jgi:hypothetical protein